MMMVLAREKIVAAFVDGYSKNSIKHDTQDAIFSSNSAKRDEMYPTPTTIDIIKTKLDNAMFDLLTDKYVHNESDALLAKKLNISVKFVEELENEAMDTLCTDYELKRLLQTPPKKTVIRRSKM